MVGDGALTCGLSYEGMNNAGHSDRDIILIVNDNGMSISPNVGAISKTLGRIVADPRTNRLRERIKGLTFALRGVFGEGVVEFAKNVEESVKNLFSPGMLFEELGFRYFGPIDGHDLAKLCDTLRFVRGMTGPRVIHVMTQKGKGFAFAESNQEKWHGLAAYDPAHRRGAEEGERPADLDPGVRRGTRDAGRRAPGAGGHHGGDAVGHRHQHLPEEVAPSASSTWASPKATRSPSPAASPPRGAAGLRHLQHLPPARLRQHHPRRRGAAAAGDLLHGPRGAGRRRWPDPHGPLRHRLHARGARHDGDRAEGRRRAGRPAALRPGAHDGPFCTRYPRDKAPAEPRPASEIPPVPYGTWEQLRTGKDVAILAVGTMVQPAQQAADLLAPEGVDCAVVNCRFLKPLDQGMLESLLQRHRTIVTVEEGTIVNGFGAYLAETLQTTHPEVRVVALGVPDRLIEQAPRAEQLELFGLTPAGIARRIAALQHEESLEAR